MHHRVIALLLLTTFTTSLCAEPVRVTVDTKDARYSGTLSVAQLEVKSGSAVGRVPLTDIASIQFGDGVDVIRTRAGTRAKGTVRVEGVTLQDAAEKVHPLTRDDVRFLIPQAPIGPIKRGKTVDAATASGMMYHVRVPDRYDAAKGGPAIVVLHGSNANSSDYLVGIPQRWPKIAADYVLIGIDGEWPVAQKDPDAPPAFNYTYVNFVGKSKFKGNPGSERESPALVAEAVAEIRQQLKLTKLFVTGHSQGGFLAYSCLMNYPDVFDGAMPIAGGLIVQCEPSAYDDPAVRQQQRKRPIAILHGDHDDVVPLSMSKSAYGSFLDAGFPMLRLMVAKDATHAFISIPFEDGIRWMESMASDDPRALQAFADRAVSRRDYRDVVAYLDREKELDPQGARGAAAARDALRMKVEQLATAPAKTLQTAIERAEGNGWVADFETFRQQFEFTDAAAPVMGAYNKLREAHEAPAAKCWADVRQAFQDENKTEGYRLCTEIVSKYYASSYYRYAKQTLEERK